MKKTYQNPQTEIVRMEPMNMMIPGSDPGEPHLLPKGHFVPGPGASYDPQGSIV